MSSDENEPPITPSKTGKRKRFVVDSEDEDYKPADDSPSKNVSPSKRQRKVKTPASSAVVVDPSNWPTSAVPVGQKMPKSRAKHTYRLSDGDFKDLPFEKHTTQVGYDASLYFERDIERKAWEKHGGPQGFKDYIAKLRATHQKKHPGKPFKAPFNWGNSLAVELSRQEQIDYFCAKIKAETKAKVLQHFEEWVWDKMTTTEEDDYEQYIGVNPSAVWSRSRQATILSAVPTPGSESHLRPYPPRPKESCPSSPVVDELREILRKAPGQTYERVEGAYMVEDYTGETDFGWDTSLEDKIHLLLKKTIETKGIDVWKVIRWEVYDAYASRFGSIHQVPHYRYRAAYWTDEAARWLRGRDTSIKDRKHMQITEAHKLYNSVLPFLTDRQ